MSHESGGDEKVSRVSWAEPSPEKSDRFQVGSDSEGSSKSRASKHSAHSVHSQRSHDSGRGNSDNTASSRFEKMKAFGSLSNRTRTLGQIGPPNAKGRVSAIGLLQKAFGTAKSFTASNLGGGPVTRSSDSAWSQDAEDARNNRSTQHRTFVDAQAMKDEVRRKLMKPKYSVKDYYKHDGFTQHIARQSWFEYLSLAVVGAYSIWIAIDTDTNNSDLLLEAEPVFQVIENLFCFLFFVEWLIKYMAFRSKCDSMRDGWFVFDSLMVWMMVLETWFMTGILLMIGTGGSVAGNTGFLRMARLLRLSRMARMARLLRALPELMIMIRGMFAAARSVFFTLCLLTLVIYVFAIAFTQLTTGNDIGNKYFQTVPASMVTLLIHGTLLDQIGDVSQDLGDESLLLVGLFWMFVLVAALTVMNMLIGVLCEVVNAVAATEKEEMMLSYVHSKLQKVINYLDADGGGTISKKEFSKVLENEDAIRCLQDVGVDVINLVDFTDFIFESDITVDEDGEEVEEEVELDFNSFFDLILQLRGSNAATVKDLADLRKFVKKSLANVSRQVTLVTQSLDDGLSVLPMDRNVLPMDRNTSTAMGKTASKFAQRRNMALTMYADGLKEMELNLQKHLNEQMKSLKQLLASTTNTTHPTSETSASATQPQSFYVMAGKAGPSEVNPLPHASCDDCAVAQAGVRSIDSEGFHVYDFGKRDLANGSGEAPPVFQHSQESLPVTTSGMHGVLPGAPLGILRTESLC